MEMNKALLYTYNRGHKDGATGVMAVLKSTAERNPTLTVAQVYLVMAETIESTGYAKDITLSDFLSETK